MLINILLLILALILLVLIVALFTKKEYTLARETTIERPCQQVFDYIRFLKNQEHYNKWVMMDPNARKLYKGTDGYVGARSSWDSEDKRVGKGKQEIKKISEGERIDVEINFIKPFKADALSFMTTEAISDSQTKMKWGFNGRMNYPMNFMLLFIDMDKLLGNDIQTSLANLKTVLETSN